MAVAAGQGAPAGVDPPVGPALAGARGYRLPRGRAWSVDEGRALLADLLARATTPERVYRHQWSVGDMVIWDNRGVLHRACRYDADLAPRHAPHDPHGDEPIQ